MSSSNSSHSNRNTTRLPNRSSRRHPYMYPNRSLNNIQYSNRISQDLRVLLNLYISIYNNINRQIDALYEDLESVRMNINDMVQLVLENMEVNRSTNFLQNATPVSNRFPRQRPRQNTPQQAQSQALTQEPSILFDSTNPNRILINNTPYIIENVEYYNTADSSNPSTIRDYTQLLQTFFSPVAIRPSENQIQHAVRTIPYSNIENPLNNSCPISLENFTNNDEVSQIIHCGHIFSREPLQHWFQSNVRCPVCRYDIRTNNEDLGTREQEQEQDSSTDSDMPPLIPVDQSNETNTMATQPTQIEEREVLSNLLFPSNNENLLYQWDSNDYMTEIESLIQTTADNLTNLFIQGQGQTGSQNTTDSSNNLQNRILFDSSNNAFILETLIWNTANQRTRH